VSKHFFVTVHGARAMDFQAVFGTATVCVKSLLPRLASLPEIGRALVYDLGLETVSKDQRQRLVEHIAKRFGLPAEDVEKDLDSHGVPILAQDCTIVVDNPWSFLT
jgi:hypothetical protein